MSELELKLVVLGDKTEELREEDIIREALIELDVE